MKKQAWRYGVVGNIVGEHKDGDLVRHGTAAYKSGAKVWLCGKRWTEDWKDITVIGVNRFGQYAVNDVPINLIQNLRIQKAYKPVVLDLMGDWEFDDWWWDDSEEDRRDAEQFIAALNGTKEEKSEAL